MSLAGKLFLQVSKNETVIINFSAEQQQLQPQGGNLLWKAGKNENKTNLLHSQELLESPLVAG